MKLSIFLLFVSLLRVSAVGYSQVVKLSLKMQDATVGEVLEAIEQNSELKVAYSTKYVDLERKVDVHVSDESVETLLEEVFSGTKVGYKIEDGQILLFDKVAQQETQQQKRIISGKITDTNGESIPGVSIFVKGTTIGGVSDIDGNFTLSGVAEDAVIAFSFVGMYTQEVHVDRKTTFNVVMEEDVVGLEEVVAIGYGVQKKVNLTGAVASIDSEILEDRPIVNVSQGLQGVLPNVNISFDGGKVGAKGDINIRGVTGLNSSGEGAARRSPLILVDGIVMDMNEINPSDIKSVSVLKDAASAAIYGARANSGVILVSTKSGQKGDVKVRVSSSVSFSKPTRIPELMDSWQYALAIQEATSTSMHKGGVPRFSEEELQMIKEYYNDPSLPYMIGRGYGGLDGAYKGTGKTGKFFLRANTDWIEETFQFMQPSYSNNISVSGGTDKVKYFISGGAYNQNGYLRYGNDKHNRYNFASKFDIKMTDWLTIFSNTKYNGIRNDYHAQDGDGGMWHSIYRMPPLTPIWTPDGDYFAYRSSSSSIPWLIDGGRDVNEEDNFYQKIGHQLRFANDKFRINGDVTYGRTTRFRKEHFKSIDMVDSADGIVRSFNDPNSVKESFRFKTYWAINEFAEYEDTFNDEHYVKFMVGTNIETQNSSTPSARGYELLNNEVPYLGMASGEQYVLGEGYSDRAICGFFYRMNYIFADKYLIEANGRYDGTSRFPKQNRWKFFPSVSAGWRMSEEPFMGWSNSFLDMLKLRLSYGSLGNQATTGEFYPFISTYNANLQKDYIFNEPTIRPVKVTPGGFVYEDLRWQTTSTVNLGADFLIKNKLNVVFEYYIRDAKDCLAPNKGVPEVIGVEAPFKNTGDIRTKGWDLSINWNDKIQDFKYGVSFVLSDNNATVTKYENPTASLTTLYEGKKIGEIWGYRTKGLIQTQEDLDASPNTDFLYSDFGRQLGDILFVDLDSDGKIDNGDNTVSNPGDRVIIGDSTPHYTFGLTLNASWKGFDFRTFFQGVGKQDKWMNSFLMWGFGDGQWQGASKYIIENSWRAEDIEGGVLPKNTINAKLPRNAAYGKHWNSKHKNDFMLQNASYIRWKDLTLGYTLPQNLTQKYGINKFRIYVNCQNLLEFTNMIEVFDPEMSGSGKVYPFYRTYSMGVNVNF